MKFWVGLYIVNVGYTSLMGNYLVVEMHRMLSYMDSYMDLYIRFYHMET